MCARTKFVFFPLSEVRTRALTLIVTTVIIITVITVGVTIKTTVHRFLLSLLSSITLLYKCPYFKCHYPYCITVVSLLYHCYYRFNFHYCQKCIYSHYSITVTNVINVSSVSMLLLPLVSIQSILYHFHNCPYFIT